MIQRNQSISIKKKRIQLFFDIAKWATAHTPCLFPGIRRLSPLFAALDAFLYLEMRDSVLILPARSVIGKTPRGIERLADWSGPVRQDRSKRRDINPLASAD
jgi:hypothetical protein